MSLFEGSYHSRSDDLNRDLGDSSMPVEPETDMYDPNQGLFFVDPETVTKATGLVVGWNSKTLDSPEGVLPPTTPEDL